MSSVVRVLCVLLLVGLSITFALAALAPVWFPYVYPGLNFNADTVSSIDPGSPAEQAGVHVGDRFGPRATFFDRLRVGESVLPLGTHLTIDMVRNGRPRIVTLNATGPVISIDAFGRALSVAAFLAFLSFAAVGTFLVLVRPNWLTWMFFLFSVGPTAKIAFEHMALLSLPMPLGFVLNMIRVVMLCVGLYAIVSFALRFPNNRITGWRHRAELLLIPFVGAYLAWQFFDWFTEFYLPTGTVDLYLFILMVGGPPLIAVASLLGTYRGATQEERHRLAFAIIGVTVGYSAIISRFIFLTLVPNSDSTLVCFGLSSLAILAPIALGYAILKHRVIDVRFLIGKAIVYSTITTLLAMALAATYWLTEVVLQQARIAAFVQLLVAVVVGFLLHRSYRFFESLVSRTLFKQRYEAEAALKRLAEVLPFIESQQSLDALIVEEPVVALDLDFGVLFRRGETGRFERLVSVRTTTGREYLEASDPVTLHVKAQRGPLFVSMPPLSGLAIPFFVEDKMEAVVIFGSHENGTALDPDEKSALAALQRPAERGYSALRHRSETLKNVSELLESVSSREFDTLHYYLANQLIDSIPERTRVALSACASLPNATEEELAFATGDPDCVSQLEALSKLSPLIQPRAKGGFALHELLSRVMATRYLEHRVEIAKRCARRASESGMYARAAELYEVAGAGASAVAELEQLYSSDGEAALLKSSYTQRGISALSFDEVKNFPRVWLNESFSRMFTGDLRVLLAEARCVREANSKLKCEAPNLLIPWCAYLHAEAGEFTAAEALLAAFDSNGATYTANALALLTRGTVEARLGHTAVCETHLRSIRGSPSEEWSALRSMIQGSAVERVRGRWDSEHVCLEAAIETLNAANSRFVVLALAEAVAGAWLAGDEETRSRYAERLRIVAGRQDARAFMHFASVAMNEECELLGIEAPRWRAAANLMRACSARTRHDAETLARLALADAVMSTEPFLELLAHLACSYFETGACESHLRNALALSDEMDVPQLKAAVRAVVADERDAGMLQPFITALHRERSMDTAPLAVDIAHGAMRRGTASIGLSERELGVAIALARSNGWTSSAELADLLWPDLDETSAQRAVQTAIYRLRQRLDDAQAVENSTHGYRLRADTVVDMTEIERFMRDLRTDRDLDEYTELRLCAAANHLDGSRPAFMTQWEWFAPIERHIEECSRVVKYRIADEAMHREDYARAVEVAQQIIARDELDEEAWKALIGARLEMGDRAWAQRELRRYRDITNRELHAEPSKEILALFESGVRQQDRTRHLRIAKQ